MQVPWVKHFILVKNQQLIKCTSCRRRFVQYMGAKYSGNIANELRNKKSIKIPPQHTHHLHKHATQPMSKWICFGQWWPSRNNASIAFSRTAEDVRVQMLKNDYRFKGNTYTDKINKLKTCQEQVCAIVLGQCMQLLWDELKQKSTWPVISKSFNPLDKMHIQIATPCHAQHEKGQSHKHPVVQKM